MGRPPRAASASTRIVGFRLTEEEERRLDELVMEQGHKDRSALLRAWLAQGGPSCSGPTSVPPVVAFAKDEPRETIRASHATKPNPSSPKQRPPRSPTSTTTPASTPAPRIFDRASTASDAGSVDDAAVLSALHKLASREPSGSLLSVRALRAMQQRIPKPRFDAAVLRLASAGKVVIHHHDFPASLPEAERAELVQDEHNTHYIGIAPREQA